MSLFGLMYISRTVNTLTPTQLQSLVARAQHKNQALNITGMLLTSDGYFFQLLEGEEAAVTRLYQTIVQDPRHTDLTLLFNEPMDKRFCPTWNMLLLMNTQISPQQTQDKITSLLAMAKKKYLQKEQLISDLFCRFMTLRQLDVFNQTENRQ
ncbi:BLUF domain-containing protein [Agitococcus lubricus]|uniref:FAD-dependent sensor of blue light n=1 Tax=Agitococcus lubricus TaxID=1077255 RepID=A0A2T5IT13_9GAMM|nr:BLUF domain-containing protein [Agitococcus lubricus]PTQ86956.1 FAD-dependent sensor of blue light [Agitococcus lubricus]